MTSTSRRPRLSSLSPVSTSSVCVVPIPPAYHGPAPTTTKHPKRCLQLACEGKALLVVSSELPELIGLCSRILVMHNGRLAGEVDRASISEAALMRLMAGVVAA